MQIYKDRSNKYNFSFPEVNCYYIVTVINKKVIQHLIKHLIVEYISGSSASLGWYLRL